MSEIQPTDGLLVFPFTNREETPLAEEIEKKNGTAIAKEVLDNQANDHRQPD